MLTQAHVLVKNADNDNCLAFTFVNDQVSPDSKDTLAGFQIRMDMASLRMSAQHQNC